MLRLKPPSLYFLILVCLFFSNCAFLHRKDGPPPPSSDIAVLMLSQDPMLYVSKLDGKGSWGKTEDHLDLAPGIHTVSLNLHKSPLKGRGKQSQEFDLSFEAKRGGKYRIEWVASKDYSRWSACIMDVAKDRRVSTLMTDAD